ncbi:MAG: BadF/BadG/BcrA/BcrD ATPase family protein [Thermoplasmata archaeon]
MKENIFYREMILKNMNYLSVDGGATKTIAIIYSEEKIFSVSVGGPSNFRNIGISSFKKNIKRIVDKVIDKTNNMKIDKATFALAGIKDSKTSTELIIKNINEVVRLKEMEFYNDGEAAFFCRFPEGEGIIIAPGTGMVSYGIWKGIKERSSGWGWLLDDEGGAFFIGKRAIQESIKVLDLRSSTSNYYNSDLPLRIKEFYGIKEDREIINKVYKKKIDIREIASIAPIVSYLASKGDSLASFIMQEAANESISTLYSTYTKLGKPKGIGVSGYGGVFRSGEWYKKMIFDGVAKLINNPIVKEPFYGYEAIIGSVVMNLKNGGYKVDENLIRDFRNQLDNKIEELDPENKKKYLFIS